MWRQVLSRDLPGLTWSILVILLSGVAGLVPACGATRDTPRVVVIANLTMPKGVLDRVSKITLTVREGSVACDGAVGQTTFPGGPDAAQEIAHSDLGTTGCGVGVRFCGDLNIERSDTPRVFSAVAKAAGDTTVAIGCASATVNQDALAVAIKMFRFIAPPNCGDGVLQPTEQCELSPGNTAICDETCSTKEILLSVGSLLAGTSTGGPGDKVSPFLLWPQQTGAQGRFFAFYTDRAGTGGKDQIALRTMSDDLSPVGTDAPPALSAGSVYLPNGATFPPPPAPFTQSAPQAAFLNGKYYVVFEDDNTPLPLPGLDVHLRSMDGTLVAEQGATALGINGGPAGIGGPSGAGESANQTNPAVSAGPKERLFIAWEDRGQGKIAGRTLIPPATLGSQNDISTGNGNTGVSVATTGGGWVAVWLGGTSVKLRVLNEDGTPQGSEQTVNDRGTVSERPRVASLPDGRFAVAWSADGDIFVQRYDAKGGKNPGDQTSSVNDVLKAGDQGTPSIAGTSAAGGSYVVAWLDAPSSHVRGRMLGGTEGFLFNHVNGQSTEFQASRAAGRERANPAVVAGGSGPFVAIGWEDRTAPGAGIVARRFPPPNE